MEIGAPAPGFTLPAANREGSVSLADTPSPEDHADFDRHQAQMIGQFLIDRDGVVRWMHVERAPGDFPSEVELLATARSTV
jgi:hypothetical protein